MPVVPQARVPLANGRSSDFILTSCSVFPKISRPHPSRLSLDSSDTAGNLIEKGLTASGNVGESHPVPILAPSPHRPNQDAGGEPNAGAKVGTIPQTTK